MTRIIMTETTETTEKTMDQFIQEQRITMEILPAHSNPNMADKEREQFHYSIVLKRPEGADLQTFFSTGLGWVNLDKVRRDWNGSNAEPIQGAILKGKVKNANAIPERYRKIPTASDVLDCLASDASTMDNARSFEEWAGDLGYDEDSRTAERTFKVCEKQAEDLRALLRDAYDECLYHLERM